VVRLAISLGDPSGIGPEVTARALAGLGPRALSPCLFGDRSFAAVAARAGLRLAVVQPGESLPAGGALVEVTRLAPADRKPGQPTPAGGRGQLAYLAAAFAAVQEGRCDALCTAPVSKAQVALALPGFAGHTEWLEERSGGRSVMMLASERLRVALVTNHLRLSRIPRAVTPDGILAVVEITARALSRQFGIARPRVAVCAMNPHAGDGGAFGDEERRLVEPALARARRKGIRASGPWPADSVFFRAVAGEFDAVVALYHDQGLIPVKLLDAVNGESAVNVTLGLPLVRTSPDHGVAYDLAGKWKANPASMVAAIRMAVRMAGGRQKSRASRRS